MDWHQFDRRNAEILQVRNLLDHAKVRAGCVDIGRRVGCESTNVHLVDDAFGEIATQVAIVLPVERFINHDTLGRTNNAVVGRQKGACQRLGIGINQPRGAVEAVANLRIIRAICLQVVKLT